MSDKDEKRKKTKGKDKNKGKTKGQGEEAASSNAISVAGHPQAGAAVRSLKGWGGLLGFMLAAYLSLRAGVPLPVLAIRALLAGIAGYMVAWACGVAAWRAIIIAEARALFDRHAAPSTAEPAKTGAAKR